MRLTRYGGNISSGQGVVQIEDLDHEEHDGILAALLGTVWIRWHKGVVQVAPGFQRAPDPVTDADIEPFWRTNAGFKTAKLKDGEPFDDRDVFAPRIEIESLCGYDYTPENYRREAAKLTNWGFICLRSRRGEDGKFWESWHLSLWQAKGALAEAIDEAGDNIADLHKRDTAKLKAARLFLCRNASFGAMNASVQVAAMTLD